MKLKKPRLRAAKRSEEIRSHNIFSSAQTPDLTLPYHYEVDGRAL